MNSLVRLILLPIVGLILGGLAGAMLGSGENRYKNKTERELSGDFSIGAFGIIGCFVGLIGGLWVANALNEDEQHQKVERRKREEIVQQSIERQQREMFAKEQLGLDKISSNYFKEGRSWQAETKWTNPETQTEHILRTAKNKAGVLVSVYNDDEYINHHEKSAAQDIVRTSHAIAERKLFESLIKRFPGNIEFPNT